jgi:hypothetical protein
MNANEENGSKRRDNEDFTNRWSIGRFCNNQWLLSSGLKLHKIKMIRMKSDFMLRKEKI